MGERRFAEGGDERRRPRGSEAHPPDGAIARLGDEFGVANRAPERRGFVSRHPVDMAEVADERGEPAGAIVDGLREAFEPQQGAGKVLPHAWGEPGRTADAEGRTQ